MRALCLVLALLASAAGAVPRRAAAQETLALSKPLNMQWAFETNDTVNFTPALGDGAVYLPLVGGTLVSLRTADGGLVWKTDMGGGISASPAADARGVYVATENVLPGGSPSPRVAGALRALGAQSGVTLWMRTLSAPLRGSLVTDATAVYGGTEDGRLYAVKKENGELLWVTQFPSPFQSHPVLREGKLYIGDEEGFLHAIDLASGRTLWRYRTRKALRAPVALAGDVVFVGSTDGSVYAVSDRTGRLLWSARTGASVQSVVATGKSLLVTSLDNFVYSLSQRKGRRHWKRLLAGRVSASPLVVSDAVLLAPLSGDECPVLDLDDGKKINSVPVGEDNNTGASPLLQGNVLLLTTRKGLLAFSGQTTTSATLK